MAFRDLHTPLSFKHQIYNETVEVLLPKNARHIGIIGKLLGQNLHLRQRVVHFLSQRPQHDHVSIIAFFQLLVHFNAVGINADHRTAQQNDDRKHDCKPAEQ